MPRQFDPTINTATLANELRGSDVSALTASEREVHRKRILESAKLKIQNDYTPFSFEYIGNTDDNIINTRDLSEILFLRLVKKNILYLNKSKQHDRDSIIRSIKPILKEGGQYRIYKMDIKDFYPNFDTDCVKEKLTSEKNFPRDNIFF